MYKTSLINLVAGMKKKKQYKDIQLLWLTLIMIISWIKLSVVKKLSFKGMWVLIVMRNHIDYNTNNAKFNVGFHYITIKHEYVNIIWIFIFFLCLGTSLTESCLSFLKITWCPNVSNSINSDLNFATSSSSMEGYHIIFNDYCVKQMLSNSWNQIFNTLLHWYQDSHFLVIPLTVAKLHLHGCYSGYKNHYFSSISSDYTVGSVHIYFYSVFHYIIIKMNFTIKYICL